MSLDCERKTEYPERTDADTGRTCKFYTERPNGGYMVVSNPGSSEAKVLTTTPSCCPYSDIFAQIHPEQE